VKELKGFQRVTLAPGEKRTVRFRLGPDAFCFTNEAMVRVVEPGWFDVMIGNSSTNLVTAVLEVRAG
jgi:beta-glucosidase